jgi:predicted DNA-binding transcriptional regulator AlpA
MMEPDPKRRMLDINELAEILDLSVQTIRNQLCKGTFPIPPKKIGGALRWDIRDVEKYLDNLKPLTKAICTDKTMAERR